MTQKNDPHEPAEEPATTSPSAKNTSDTAETLATEDESLALQNDGIDSASDEVDIGDVQTSLEEERDELRDQLLRALADNENLRRRTERELAAAKKYGAIGFARDLMASVDNLEKAIELIPENKDKLDETLKNILIGVEMTGREIASVLERHAITKIQPVGEKFDYNFHQAMFEVPTNDAEPGTVIEVVQSGYQLHDRLLRPAMVGVSKPAEEQETQASTPETEN